MWWQVITGDGHDMRADVWSVGITAVELAQGHPPHFSMHNPLATMLRYGEGERVGRGRSCARVMRGRQREGAEA